MSQYLGSLVLICISIIDKEIHALRSTQFDKVVKHAGTASGFLGIGAFFSGVFAPIVPVIVFLGPAASGVQYARELYKTPKMELLESRKTELKILDRRLNRSLGFNF